METRPGHGPRVAHRRFRALGARALVASTSTSWTTPACTSGPSATSTASGRRSPSTSGVIFHDPPTATLGRREMPGTQWFPGSTLNYAEHALTPGPGREDDDVAAIAVVEDGTERVVTHAELRDLVARARAGLAAAGVGRGDRVVAMVPNSVETLVAFLATASLGAVWSSCSPDFGARAVLDRFAQIEPTVLVAVDGYRYNGRAFDVRERVAGAAEGAADAEGDGAGAAPRPRRDAGRHGAVGGAHRHDRAAGVHAGARSTTRCGCCTPRGRPGCPRASCSRTAGSSSSTSRRWRCTTTSARATGSCGSPPPAG